MPDTDPPAVTIDADDLDLLVKVLGLKPELLRVALWGKLMRQSGIEYPVTGLKDLQTLLAAGTVLMDTPPTPAPDPPIVAPHPPAPDPPTPAPDPPPQNGAVPIAWLEQLIPPGFFPVVSEDDFLTKMLVVLSLAHQFPPPGLFQERNKVVMPRMNLRRHPPHPDAG